MPRDWLTVDPKTLAAAKGASSESVSECLAIAGAAAMQLVPIDADLAATLAGAPDALEAWWAALEIERLAEAAGDDIETGLALVHHRHEVDLWIAGLCALGLCERQAALSQRIASIEERFAAAMLRCNRHEAVRGFRRVLARRGYPTGAVPPWVTRMIDTSEREIVEAVAAGLCDEAAVSAATRDAVVNDPVARDVFLEQCEVADKASGSE